VVEVAAAPRTVVVVLPGRVVEAAPRIVVVVPPGAVVVVAPGAVVVVAPGAAVVVAPGIVVELVAPGTVVVVIAHVGLVTVSLINDTWPVRARSRPSTTAPSFTEILALAMTVPTNWVVVSIVAEVPTCQKMSQAEALLSRTTLDPGAVVSVLPIWKM
jgi:hypothetical protein